MPEPVDANTPEWVAACERLWGILRAGAQSPGASPLGPSFRAVGYPLSDVLRPGSQDATELEEFFRAGGGLTNLVHVLSGVQHWEDFAVVNYRWVAERGLGEEGSPSYISGRVTLTLRRDESGWRVCGWLGAAGPHAPEDAGTRPADAEAIREQILRVFEAYRQGDLAMLRRTHTREWRGFSLRSSGVGRGIDAYMRGAEGAIASMQFQEYRILEFDAIFYGDLAVVPYVARIAGVDRRGREEAYRLRVLDVYLREPTGWNQVATNVGLHPEEVRST